ncbi:hypothetical protein IFU39_00070 [Paenibacillus sp. CFBP 13594]|uniref:hypothetical protein n=1 Tax=Paenibacillus sp. CFBP 13594 TaxID=2774037 RepID=UPI00178377F7|nr:hypothetical protein [Paenibacillus sp. CFBP 13594]MBD8836213.1 hypothetical protein [Paenibacillus sp. CFBP 13594]
MPQIYLSKQDKEAAEIVYFIYKDKMESGGVLTFNESGEEDIEGHYSLVDKIESLFVKLRNSE